MSLGGAGGNARGCQTLPPATGPSDGIAHAYGIGKRTIALNVVPSTFVTASVGRPTTEFT